jgi:hypothetical protein
MCCPNPICGKTQIGGFQEFQNSSNGTASKRFLNSEGVNFWWLLHPTPTLTDWPVNAECRTDQIGFFDAAKVATIEAASCVVTER